MNIDLSNGLTAFYVFLYIILALGFFLLLFGKVDKSQK